MSKLKSSIFRSIPFALVLIQLSLTNSQMMRIKNWKLEGSGSLGRLDRYRNLKRLIGLRPKIKLTRKTAKKINTDRKIRQINLGEIIRGLFIIFLCISLSSCINQIIGITRSPEAVVDAVTTDTANKLVGKDVKNIFSESDTASSIDKALKNNPNASNEQNLRDLRNTLDENKQGVIERSTDSINRREQHNTSIGNGSNKKLPYLIDNGNLHSTREILTSNRPSVPLEKKIPNDRLLRSRDDWRFPKVPKNTILLKK